MTEATTGDAASANARAAEQARLRKERREAKIRAGGAARLNKITGLGGGIERDPQRSSTSPAPSTAASPAPAASQPEAAARHDDPEEVDISEHYYAPQTRSLHQESPSPQPTDPANMSEAQLRQLMLGFDPAYSSASGGGNPFFDGGMPAGMGMGAEDPMLKMLNQMMADMPGGGGGGGSSASPFAQTPQMPQQQAPAGTDRYAAIWRLLHFVVAAGLGLYVALLTPFSGTKIERERAALFASTIVGGGFVPTGQEDAALQLQHRQYEDQDAKRRLFFYAFATAEAVLLTTRLFLDRRRAANGSPAPLLGGAGILGMVLGFLPPHIRGYIEVGTRYAQIISTVRSDLLVCVFVLGACSWFRGGWAA